MYKFAIVIPVWNNSHFTKSCLADLSHLPNDHQIIVVDNGSTDNTKQIVKNSTKSISYIQLDKNYGFAYACNKGFEEANAEYVCFLNNDIRVRSNHSDWTSKIIAKASEGFVVGPTIGVLDNNFNYIKETNIIPKDKLFCYMSGWNITAKCSIWNSLKENADIGPFSTIFFAYFEDADLSFRIMKAGISFSIVDVPIVHFGRMTGKKLGLGVIYTLSKQKFIEKWEQHTEGLLFKTD